LGWFTGPKNRRTHLNTAVTGSALFIAPSAYPLGGVAVWLDYLTPALEQFGWHGTAGLVAGRCHDVAAYCAAYPALPVVPIHNPTGSHEGRIRAIERVLIALKPEIVVGVNVVDIYPAAQRLRQRGQAIKVAMALHGIAADLLGDLAREAPSLDAVIATNRLACRLCIDQAGMPAERVLYAPYGVDVGGLGSLARLPRGGPLRIVWVGRLEQQQKRVDDLPGIVAELDRLGVDYVLRIVGDGPQRVQTLRALAPWLKNGRVVYAGVLPATELGAKAYAQADVLLLTSSWETGPIVIWEAMAAGVAIVTSRYVGSGLEDALHHEQNCLVFPVGDTAQAARQLGQLAVDARLCESLVAAGAALVAARYSVSQSVSGWAQRLNTIKQLPDLAVQPPRLAPKSAGRLDRLAGVQLAETTRAVLGIAYRHTEPGGEWPHTAAAGADEDQLLALAGVLDRGA